MEKYIIAPSILAANAACLGAEVQAVLNAGADWIHIDVMDNHYAGNLAFGPHFCADFRKFGITAPFDVHLATKPVDNLIAAFAHSGANYITFHPEATDDINRSLGLIHQYGLKAGLAFSPEIPLTILSSLQYPISFISILGVNPGFGGQTFFPSTFEKIKESRAWIDKHDSSIRLSVDGGINIGNIKDIKNAGADTFMIGSSIFNTEDYQLTLQAFRRALVT